MQNYVVFTALAGLVILALVLIAVNAGSFKSAKQNKLTFLIVGPSGSGKTALFSRWATGTVQDTVQSSAVNEYDEIKVPFGADADGDADAASNAAETVRIVDIPGHSKLRHLVQDSLSHYGDAVRGIVFVVDSASGQKGVSDAASFLYWLLQRTEKRAGGVSILVAANKSDVFNAVSVPKLLTTLEKEIDLLRSSKSKGVGDVDELGEGDDGAWIGLDGEFRFVQLEGEFAVLDGSVKADRTSKWDNWVQQLTLNE